MTGITMYDTAQNSQFPAGGQAYAAYVDGSVDDQPNYAYIVTTFPTAQHLSIALFASDNADALDVEPGAASPGDVPGWYKRQRQRGIDRPCVYASASTMTDSILPVLAGAGIARGSVRLWSAHYGQGEHICGPASCGLVPVDMDGTQWTSSALGRSLDQSLLLPGFFGVPAPVTVEVNVKLQVLRAGTSGQQVRNWQGLLVSHGLGFMIAPDASTPGMSAEERAGVDGVFGGKTDAATRKFQEDRHLTAGGVVDAATWTAALSA